VGGGGPLNVSHHTIYCFLDIITKLEEEAQQLEEDRKRAAEKEKVLLHFNIRMLSQTHHDNHRKLLLTIMESARDRRG
jgi:hypothetical protein